MAIYYWTGVSGNGELIKEHQEDIKRLLTGDYPNSDLEKLKQKSSKYPIYSFRINQKARLLFTTHKGKLYVLEYLPNHNYSDSRFLKRGVLNKRLERFDGMEGDLFELVPEDEHLQFLEQDERQAFGIDYFNGRFIQLSDAQKVMTQFQPTQLPVLLLGTQGTGKTYIGLSLLRSQMEIDPTGKYLYVTQEPKLVDCMHNHWKEGFCSMEIEGASAVDFLDYESLFKTNTDGFTSWFKHLKANKAWAHLSREAIYREFRICSGFTKEAYIRLGKRQSLIPEDKRASFYESLFEPFIRGTQDTEFHLQEINPTYQFIVIDEAHNFTPAQLHNLTCLAVNHQVLLCMDSHQNMHDTCSLRTIVEQSFLSKDIQLQEAELTECLRNTKQVLHLLNRLLSVTRVIQNGLSDKREALIIPISEEAEEGEFHIMTPILAKDLLVERTQTTEFAVVTASEFIEEARTHFNTPLVFTPEEIMGQDFHSVAVYKYFETKEMQALLKAQKNKFPNDQLPDVIPHHLPSEQSNYYFSPGLKALYVAISRATHSIFIVEKERNYLLNILNHNAPTQTIQKVTLDTNWGEMAEKQKDLGHTEIAELIEKKVAGPVIGDSKPTKQDKATPLLQTSLFNYSERNKRKNKQPFSTTQISEPVYDEQKSLLFIETCKAGMLKQVREALKNPAVNPNYSAEDSGGATSLLQAAANPQAIEVVRFLINHPRVDVTRKTSNSASALYVAAVSGSHLIVQLLVQSNKFKINDQDIHGTTALIAAASHGHERVVKILLGRADIDINKKAKGNVTALLAAIEGAGITGENNSRFEQYVIIIDCLLRDKRLQFKPDSNKEDYWCYLLCLSYALPSILEKLLKSMPSLINLRDEGGHTALMLAVGFGKTKSYLEIIEILFKQRNLDFNCVNKKMTAFMFAVEQGNIGIIQQFLSQGSKVNVLYQEDNESALTLALKHPNDNVIRTLLTDERLLNYAVRCIAEPSLLKDDTGMLSKLERILPEFTECNAQYKTMHP